MRDSIFGGGGGDVRARQLSPTSDEEPRGARLYLNNDYISLTQPDMDYLDRMFHVVQQKLRDYLIALPTMLSYVTASLTLVSYIEPMPNASKHIYYPHLYEEFLTFV